MKKYQGFTGTIMKKYQDFTGTITKKSRSIMFGCRFTLQNDTDTINVHVGKDIYDIFSEGTQLRIGHIGKKLINIRPTEKLSKDAVLWNSFIDTFCFADIEKIAEMNECQRNAVLSFQYDAEVNSGGHTGYFDIFSDIDYGNVIKALESIGASRYAEILKNAVKNKNDDYDFETEDDEFYGSEPDLGDTIRKYVISRKEEIGCQEE